MHDSHDVDTHMEDEYNEEEDSDFEAGNADEEIMSTSSDDEEAAEVATGKRPLKRRKVVKPKKAEEAVELDSGDEATIKEREKALRLQRKKGELEVDEDEDEKEQGWRAKTRSMRERDKEEKKKSKLATIKGSTIDVDKIWEEMNRPGGVETPAIVAQSMEERDAQTFIAPSVTGQPTAESMGTHGDMSKENAGEEMITIKRTYKFAGEVHTEEKKVPKSSAEARLWLSQQSFHAQTDSGGGVALRRPLRKISRFDPNYNNMLAFKMNWSRDGADREGFKGPKLNTVEKSKMDWAAHVDTEGLKDELDEHAKAKEGYLSRMDFLGEVEQRKDADARAARLRG